MLQPRRRPLHALLAAAVAAAAVAVACLPGAAAQQVSPLEGQGKPNNSTTTVWFSMYLDRLISVDDTNYRHASICMVYMSWQDTEAAATVANNTAAWRAGQRDCAKPCTDWGRDVACCDGIYLPSILFRNAYAFPQDRPTAYNIWLAPNNTVFWMTWVQGEYYQQLSLRMLLRNFPFDSFDLGIATEFLDTSEAPHPGVNIVLSGAGTQKYMFGVGDDVSDWKVESVALSGKRSNESFVFQLWSAVPSAPSDLLPLSTPAASRTITPLLPGGGLRGQQPVQMVFLKIRVSRFWKYHVLNTIVPVALLGWLSFVVFVLPRKDLATRLGVVVTLFLALAAVAFVVTADQPSSSYILPTQQQILTTYCLLLIMALESILVFHVEQYKQLQQEAQARRTARQRYLAALKALEREHAGAKAAAAAEKANGNGGLPTQQPPPPDDMQPADSMLIETHPSIELPPGVVAAQAAAAAHPSRRRLLQAHRLGRGTTTYQLLKDTLKEDHHYSAWLARQIDIGCACFLFLGYNLAVILIYTLQHGYIDLLKWE